METGVGKIKADGTMLGNDDKLNESKNTKL